jgi:methylated-DNA-[protein]-cysteine S-methyltransferase
MKNIYFYDTLVGKVGIADNGEAITDLMYVGAAGVGAAGDGLQKSADEGADSADSTNSATGTAAGIAAGVQELVSNLYSANLKETPLIRKAAKQLNEYLAGRRKTFELPLDPEGTPFQKAVWKTLTGIPYGESRTYKDIAETVGNPKACRAVGMANNKNPIAILIPCHRVIGAGGKLVGYAGGLDIKKKLLELEK